MLYLHNKYRFSNIISMLAFALACFVSGCASTGGPETATTDSTAIAAQPTAQDMAYTMAKKEAEARFANATMPLMADEAAIKDSGIWVIKSHANQGDKLIQWTARMKQEEDGTWTLREFVSDYQ
jgi:hypothetical protein